MSAIDIVIMAAGKGTRMKSQRPKVLHRLAGRPLLAHVLDSATALGARAAVVITGHGAADVEAFCAAWSDAAGAVRTRLQPVRQEPQLGTGHAVQQATPVLPDDGVTLILNGDVPLVRTETMRRLLALAGAHGIALLTVDTGQDAGAYGRIVRGAAQDDGDVHVRAIVEARDASPDERQITEWYSGVMAAPTRLLKRYLALLTDDNAQREFYLTDVVKHAVADGTPVLALRIDDEVEVAGVNSPVQLAELEREVQRRAATRLMDAGVRLADPARFDLRGELQCGQDVEIDVGCIFEGRVALADEVRIGAHCFIANARIEAGAVIQPFTHIDGGRDGVVVGAGTQVGPYARLRPGAQLGPDVHIGNFVEVKNSTLAAGAKANHLAYLGDATVGERVNYGAGSITANYDGANKHRTVIEADVHVGSNCVLVAPVTIGAGGTVGGGSTITRDTPAGALSVARGQQISVAGWQRPVKQRKT
ncbi:bifunctional UDP-N-acetylglucosamine diphosphorylase/glucosamine-1-phosphate N-acetyltransferase GlmU [Ottowia sp.]|uniref:bifunctional UDP-N-acetylglucosamine diphosphorylase/glucosamine-1-phosphate N-acetyltransferase GlmU n=1 Tax=Ottowia sp. TaxID=1898956 RepID=UPI002B96D550|nr:bifunctional UDP-N-acetylglucosamine diphosphorylase/glucosamine-1-phosphate N-acetyltransferase GlmU [Ottowia sp.]HRN77251.1 bifunctional UDP-N-acetylglucosamine diphosphorylase/glucosamine-1-phosphate N-acetyltransferase GlmU [Ottowia sp.]HRQ03673.1 bifunctional UDP-N-acetylglucosamine diphosphorylase/glucosamine-1-phosphate N-acetyltransferase GlmU [Ottowia sp.]